MNIHQVLGLALFHPVLSKISDSDFRVLVGLVVFSDVSGKLTLDLFEFQRRISRPLNSIHTALDNLKTLGLIETSEDSIQVLTKKLRRNTSNQAHTKEYKESVLKKFFLRYTDLRSRGG